MAPQSDTPAADVGTVIAVAPNGARRTPADHPALPVTPDGLAACAHACRAAGASMMHLHVRDAALAHSLDVQRYRDATAAIRASVGADFVVQVTTEAVGRYDAAQQRELVRALRPQAASVALKELCPPGDEAAAGRFYRDAVEGGVALQHILYAPDEVQRLMTLMDQGVIPREAASVLFVLGRYSAGQVSSLHDLLPFLSVWDGRGPWMMCAFGPQESACAAAAMAFGGHVRVGFENNLHLADGSVAPDNAALVAQAAAVARAIGRPPANPAQAAHILGARLGHA